MKWHEVYERSPSGSVAPIKPLTPAQARKRSEKTQRINQKIADERTRTSKRLSDLEGQKAQL